MSYVELQCASHFSFLRGASSCEELFAQAAACGLDALAVTDRKILAVLLGFATVVLILLCQYFWPGGVQPGGVVLCIVLFSTPIETYMSYALNRIFDTAIGVIAALLVNYFLPRPRVVSLGEGFKGSFKEDSKVWMLDNPR